MGHERNEQDGLVAQTGLGRGLVRDRPVHVAKPGGSPALRMAGL